MIGKITNNKGTHSDTLASQLDHQSILQEVWQEVRSSSQIKCRDGHWSVPPLPACATLGSCLHLEQIENGRNVPIQGSRQSAFKFKCRKGFKLYGVKRTYCEGVTGAMPACLYVLVGCIAS